MKRLISLALSMVMLLALAVPAASAAEAKPAPPDWVKAEEYAVFRDGAAYQPENWARILRLRADAAAGHTADEMTAPLKEDYAALRALTSGKSTKIDSASLCFELGLINLRYRCSALSRKLPLSKTSPSGVYAGSLLSSAMKLGAAEPENVYRAQLWEARNQLLNFCDLYAKSSRQMEDFAAALQALYQYPQFKSSVLLDWDMAALVPEEYRAMVQDGIIVTLDGELVHPAILSSSPVRHELSAACVKNGWTMVPVRRLAELTGADVSYSNGVVTILRAGASVKMTIGSRTASVNGKTIEMTAAPVKENGRTYIPVRYIGEFFGQDLEWVTPGQLSATENRAAAGTSNLEAWALPMGAILAQVRHGDPALFGEMCRVGETPESQYGAPGQSPVLPAQAARSTLESGWGITCRKDLVETVCAMTFSGHNSSFQEDAALIDSLSPAQYQQLLKNAQGMDQYMFPYTKQLHEKWGDRGILCWDLFRMSNLVQWGYLAGYVTYPEALALLEPAATLLHDHFKSWDEAYENYLDGYNWWARNNVLGQNIWETERGKIYTAMKADPARSALFDNQLFKTPVRGVPGLTAEQVLASVQ